MNCSKNVKGQIALITLLILSVVLVITLSVVSRSIEDVGLSSRDDQSTRALNAAEAGIEQFLATGQSEPGAEFGSGSTFTASVSDYAGGGTAYLYPRKLVSGDTATFWFVEHDDDDNLSCADGGCSTPTTINICWGDTDITYSPMPAIEAIVFYDNSLGAISGNFSQVEIDTSAIDPDTSRISDNEFTQAVLNGCNINGTNYSYRGILNLTNSEFDNIACDGLPGCILAVVVRMLYTAQDSSVGVWVNNATTLPAQAKLVESVGTSGDATRKLEVIQPYPELPPVFMAAMFSQGDIIK